MREYRVEWDNLPELLSWCLDRVRYGARIIITVASEPMAAIVPYDDYVRLEDVDGRGQRT
jgi:prevent-host-death family protein